MKWLVGILAIGCAAWLWYHYTHPAPVLPPPVRPGGPIHSGVRHIICPICQGRKVLLYDEGTKKDDCPICINSSGMSVGYREIRVPPGNEVCPNCKGMGLMIVNKLTR